jgi:hypothetical protein
VAAVVFVDSLVRFLSIDAPIIAQTIFFADDTGMPARLAATPGEPETPTSPRSDGQTVPGIRVAAGERPMPSE